ncbi:MAG: TlpA family protein disulfide reductase [Chitinophagaceae bacterium]|nr:TlpA family protein disulfide reductase [Chitinophagaceae bacterium]
MKISIILAALLLKVIIIIGQNKAAIVTGEKFSYSANKQLNMILAEERHKGRKVIIDLFSSSCIVCFRMLPKMEDIQRKYKDSIRIVLLGKKDIDVKKIFEKYKSKFSLTLEAIYDSAFFEQYQIPSMPHYIWLDEKGIIKATTGTEELNYNYFENFISGSQIITKDVTIKQNFDQSKLFLVNGNGGHDTSFLFRSILSSWSKNQSTSYPKKLQYSTKGKFFQTLNVSITDLYKYAYLGWAWWTSNDTIYGKIYPVPIEIGGEKPIDNSVRYNYSFSTSLPDSGNLLLRRAIRNDLETYFDYTATVVSRKMPCWKLIAIPDSKARLKSKYQNKKYSESYTSIDYQKVNISTVIDLLMFSRQDDYPLIDATGIDFPIDLLFDAIIYDRESVVNALRGIGLDLILSEQPMLVLLLQKK